MNNGRLQLEFEMAQGFLRVHWTRLGCNGDLRARLELSFSSSLYFVLTPESRSMRCHTHVMTGEIRVGELDLTMAIKLPRQTSLIHPSSSSESSYEQHPFFH